MFVANWLAAVGVRRRAAEKSARSRRLQRKNTDSLATCIEACEPRVLLSATPAPIDAAMMAPGSDPDAEYILLPSEKVFNFVQSPTITSIAGGNWNDVSIWSEGRLPTAGDVVRITDGTVVTYNHTSDQAIEAIGIEPGAKLQFATDTSTRLTVGTLIVFAGGELEIGTEQNPIQVGAKAEIVIADQPLDLVNDVEQHGTGILGFGKVTIHGAAKDRTWLGLANEPRAGDTELVLEAVPVGWQPGDTVVIPDSRQVDASDGKIFEKGQYTDNQWEEVVIDHIEGNRVVLVAPVQFDHLGARDEDGNLLFLPHAALIDRNVEVRSANPDGTRGHVLFAGRADVDIRYARFTELGRTDAFADLDNTTFSVDVRDNGSGEVYTFEIAGGHVTDVNEALPGLWTAAVLNGEVILRDRYKVVQDTTELSEWQLLHVGTNQIARYAMHMHHVMGPVNLDNTGYQFKWIGNTVDRATKWSYTVHGTSYGLIQDNVAYIGQGAGFVTEDGSEIENEFIRNFSLAMQGTGKDGKEGTKAGDYGRGGVGFWMRRTGNIFRDNVTANNTYAGYVLTSYYEAEVLLPNFRGAMRPMPGQGTFTTTNPSGVFEGNEVYGLTPGGLWIALPAGMSIAGMDQPIVFSNTTIWHTHRIAIESYHTNNVKIDGFDIIFDSAASMNLGDKPDEALDRPSVGIEVIDYENDNLEILNGRIEGGLFGIQAGSSNPGGSEGGTPDLFEDLTLRNYINIQIRSAKYNRGKGLVIRGVDFDQLNVPPIPGELPQLNIHMDYTGPTLAQDLIYVYDYGSDEAGTNTVTILGNQLVLTPVAGFTGDIQVTATISDGFQTYSETFTVSVANTLPTLDIGDRTLSPTQPSLAINLPDVDPDGDTLTYSAQIEAGSPALSAAFALDQSLGLYMNGDYGEDWAGLGEKWMQSASGTPYYITPDGKLYRWEGSVEASVLVATFDPSYHADPTKLHDAPAVIAISAEDGDVMIVGNQLIVTPAEGFDGDIQVTATISDGFQTHSETFTVSVANTLPALDIGDRTLSPTQPSLSISLPDVDPDGDTLTYTAEIAGGDPLEALAYQIDQSLGLYKNGSYGTDWAGLGEKWMQSASATPYFITPDGSLYRWQGSIAGSVVIATFDASYHADPAKLHDAPEPAAGGGDGSTATIVGNQLVVTPADGYIGDIQVTVTIGDGFQTHSETFTVSVANTLPALDIGDQTLSPTQPSLSISLPDVDPDGDTLTYTAEIAGGDPLEALAYQIDQSLGLYKNGSYGTDWAGLGEKWMQSASATPYFITPDGSLYRWQGSIAGSVVVATFDASYHADPAKLHDAPEPSVSETPGANFQLFYFEQGPGFVIPEIEDRLASTIEPDLTNQQNWQQYGIAIGGQIATSTTTREGIFGYTSNDVSPPPSISDVNVVRNDPTSATITWTSNVATQGIVGYDQHKLSGNRMASNWTPLGTTHQITLTNLDATDSYNVRVKALDPTNNKISFYEFRLTAGGGGLVAAAVDEVFNIVPGSQTTDEDTSLTFNETNGNLVVVDVDTHGEELVEVQLGVTNGTITLSTIENLTFETGDGTTDSQMTFSGSQIDVNAALDGFAFDPTPDFNGTAALSLITSASDGTSDTDGVSITVDPVVDASTLSVPGAQTALVNTELAISGIVVDSPDLPGFGGLFTVTLTAMHGVLTVDQIGDVPVSADIVEGGPYTLILSGMIQQINSQLASLTYLPDQDYVGDDVLTISVQDQTNVQSGDPVVVDDTIAITTIDDADVFLLLGLSSPSENDSSPDASEEELIDSVFS